MPDANPTLDQLLQEIIASGRRVDISGPHYADGTSWSIGIDRLPTWYPSPPEPHLHRLRTQLAQIWANFQEDAQEGEPK